MIKRFFKWLFNLFTVKPDPAIVEAPTLPPRRSSYRRTSGYRNWMNQRYLRPVVEGDIARFSDGTKYMVWGTTYIRVAKFAQMKVEKRV